MNSDLKYMPVLRLRQQEVQVLTHFYFGKHIYPCVEIIRDGDKPQVDEPKDKKKKKKAPPKTQKPFEGIYAPILANIPAEKVFVDLPVHMEPKKGVQEDVVRFLLKVVTKRKEKTECLKKLGGLAGKIIPVITTYAQVNAEPDSIIIQENDLRPHFPALAFRTMPITFENDLQQIQKVARENDFLIVDLGNYLPVKEDEDVIEVMDRLKQFKNCHIILLRAAMDGDITNVGLEHGIRVFEADNRLLKNYRELGGHSFGDYAGIKKDKVNDGRGKSPGFIIYNPLDNDYYGFRGTINKEGKSNQELSDFENVIVPDVMKSDIIKRMQECELPYLNINNRGWLMLQNIFKKIDKKTHIPAKFKRISMEHYLHCMRTKIDAGHFD